jgi:HEPN domain-containing protein
MEEWKNEILAEFERAEQARARGNEGQARVCARRAAGIAARQYFARQGRPLRTPSAYELLNLLAKEPRLSPDLRQAAVYLTLRVNEEFKLPVEVDLIAEARKLCTALLAQAE